MSEKIERTITKKMGELGDVEFPVSFDLTPPNFEVLILLQDLGVKFNRAVLRQIKWEGDERHRLDMPWLGHRKEGANPGTLVGGFALHAESDKWVLGFKQTIKTNCNSSFVITTNATGGPDVGFAFTP